MEQDPRRTIDRTADLIWRFWKTEPLTLVVPVREGLRQARRNPVWYIPVTIYVSLGIYGLLREGTGAAREPREEPRPDREAGRFQREGSGRAEKRRPAHGRRGASKRRPAV